MLYLVVFLIMSVACSGAEFELLIIFFFGGRRGGFHGTPHFGIVHVVGPAMDAPPTRV